MKKHPKKFPPAAYVLELGKLINSGEITANAKTIHRGTHKYNATNNYKVYLETGQMIWTLLKHEPNQTK